MRSKLTLFVVPAALLVFSAGAAAQTMASATTDLNIRSGPGPQYDVIGAIDANGEATVNGCIQGSKWCTVSYNGVEGWAYSDYLVAPVSGAPTVLTDRYAEIGVPVTTYEPSGADTGTAAGMATGAVGGAIVGALIGGPPGAIAGGAVGAISGSVGGAATGALVEPAEEVTTYVRSNPVDAVYLDGEVVVGAGVPETVTLTPIPNSEYHYAYVNGQPVLIEPAGRRIVRVVR
ncbi:MAG TPA: DUF1236 domain-containing protein [Methylomirabilota bacterium]|nr:DUF1236 domain-containing protein [Methylomirabilota bacterium]